MRPDLRPERLDLRPERLDLRPERLDLKPERPNLRPERLDLRFERMDMRPERPDLRPEGAVGGDERTNKLTKGRTNESLPVFYKNLLGRNNNAKTARNAEKANMD